MVPAVAAMPAPATSADTQEVSSIVISAGGLNRFGGNNVAGAAAPKLLFSTSLDLRTPAQFPSLEASLEIPVCMQLLTVSVLLGIFAAAIAEDDSDSKDSKDSKDYTVKLVRPAAITARFAGAVGCFAMHAASRTEAVTSTPAWVWLVCISLSLGIFASAAYNAEVESKQQTKQVIKLVSVPAIAGRLAFAAGLFGAPGATRAMASGLLDLFSVSSGSMSFPSSRASMDVPAWAQLLTVSVLLSIFAAAASDEQEKEEDDATKKEKKTKHVELVRAPAIAARLAAAAFLFCMPGAVRAASTYLPETGLMSSPMFPSAETSMDIPMWAQLLLASVLLGVFAAAVSDDDDDDKIEKSSNVVDLVRVPAIAARLAVAAALFGAPGAAQAASAVFGPSTSFPISELNTEIPVSAQFAVVSLLLGVFAAAVSEDVTEDEQDIESGVKLVCVPSIAGRLAVAAGCFAVYAAVLPSVPAVSFGGVKSLFIAAKAIHARMPITSSPVFASAETTLDTPVWTQLLVVSFLLLVFAVLVKSESAEDKDTKASSKQVQLVRPDAIAARLGVAAAVFAVREVMPPLVSNTLSGDVLAKGGLLVAGTAFALSGEIQKSMCTKKVV